MYRLTDYGAMVRDSRRIDAYRSALSAVISPSTTVLDLGSGVGTFSIIASKLGAARVYSVEAADVITVAEQLARANGVADRITFIRGRSTEIELPERVDVIVSDLNNALPLYDEHLPTIVDARARFLKPGGTLIPRSSRLFCAPVSNAALYARIVEPWRSVRDVDLAVAERMVLQGAHAMPVAPEDLAGEPRVWGELDYATLTSPNVTGSAEWTIGKTVHGIALWFESTMHGEVRLSSGPRSQGSVHATMVLPLLEPLDGHTLHLNIDSTLAAGRYVTTWHARTDTHAGSRQSTFFSEPHSEAFHPSDRVLARRVAQELLLLDTSTGVYHVLNETGAQVWELLQHGANVDSIVGALATQFEIEPARAREDVAAVVAELRQAKLVEVVP
jgi:type I protein arginine methyltransferase